MKIIKKTELKNEILELKENVTENFNKLSQVREEMLEEVKKSQEEVESKMKSNIEEGFNNLTEDRKRMNDELTKRIDEQHEFLYQESQKRQDEIRKFKEEEYSNLSNEFSKIKKENEEMIKEGKQEYLKLLNESENQVMSLVTKSTTDQQNKVDTCLSSIDEKVNKTVKEYVDETSVNGIVEKSINVITDAFNSALGNMDEKEKKSLAEAVTKVYVEQIIKKDEKETIEPLREDELFHEKYNELKHCVANSFYPMLVGPAGTGKSHAVIQLAKDLQLPFYTVSRVQNNYDLIGFIDAGGKYHKTQFYEAYTNGGLFFFDEIDASNPETLVTINTAVVQGFMAFPGRTRSIKMHPNFKMVCAANTYGKGATTEYNGRNKLDAATLDRFFTIPWGYSNKLEEGIIKDKELLNICWAIRDVTEEMKIKIIVSTRGIKFIDDMLQTEKNPFSVAFLLKQKFFAGESEEIIKEIIENVKGKIQNNKYIKEMEELI